MAYFWILYGLRGEKLWNGVTVTPELAKARDHVIENIRKYESEGRRVPENILNGARIESAYAED